MTALALRERNRHFSDIGRTRTALIRAGERIVDEEYRRFWIDLEKEGVGKIVYGRRGNPDRFEWYHALKMVADCALTGKDITIEPQSMLQAEEEKPAPKKAAAPKKSVRMTSAQKKDKVEHAEVASAKGSAEKLVVIPLRKDFFLEVKMPADVSKDEMEVIQEALKRASA
jgi:hypothetical protein